MNLSSQDRCGSRLLRAMLSTLGCLFFLAAVSPGAGFALQKQITATGQEDAPQRQNDVLPQSINAAVKAFIMNHAPWKADQIKINRLTFDQIVSVPPGKVTFQVAAPLHVDWLGPIPFSVQIIVNGQVVRKVIAPATIEVWSDVVLSAKPLGKFEPIEADDIVVRKMNLARIPSNAILQADQVLGQRTNRNVAANSVLRHDQVETAPIIKRGDVVQMIAESTILRVSAKGLAKENGAKGDRIQVMNMNSKKIIYGQVMDDQTVQVEF